MILYDSVTPDADRIENKSIARPPIIPSILMIQRI